MRSLLSWELAYRCLQPSIVQISTSFTLAVSKTFHWFFVCWISVSDRWLNWSLTGWALPSVVRGDVQCPVFPFNNIMQLQFCARVWKHIFRPSRTLRLSKLIPGAIWNLYGSLIFLLSWRDLPPPPPPPQEQELLWVVGFWEAVTALRHFSSSVLTYHADVKNKPCFRVCLVPDSQVQTAFSKKEDGRMWRVKTKCRRVYVTRRQNVR